MHTKWVGRVVSVFKKTSRLSKTCRGIMKISIPAGSVIVKGHTTWKNGGGWKRRRVVARLATSKSRLDLWYVLANARADKRKLIKTTQANETYRHTDCLYKPQKRDMISSMSLLVTIWKIRHWGPGCGFVWILSWEVKYSCLSTSN